MSALFSVPTLTYGIPGSFDVAPGGFCASYARRLNLGLKTGLTFRIPLVLEYRRYGNASALPRRTP